MTHPLLLALAVSLGLSACASLQTARIELPEALSEVTPVALDGPIGQRRGDFRLGALQGRFERQASRLELFGVLAQDRAAVSYTLQPDGLRADCKLIGNTATLAALQLPIKRAGFACTFSREGQALPQRLELKAADTAFGTRDERLGHWVAAGLTLELQSLHRVQGSTLPLSAPAGYVMRHQGQPVAALDLNGVRPQLWHRTGAPELTAAVQHAALALALLWDPASR